MSIREIRVSLVILALILILIGCESKKTKVVIEQGNNVGGVLLDENTETVSIGGSNSTSVGKSDTTKENSSTEGSIRLTNDDIIAIYLMSEEGKILKSDYTGLEIDEILYALFDSEIVEFQHNEPLLENYLTIIPEDGPQLRVYSYGQEGYVLGVVEDEMYHLKSDLISDLLLTNYE